MFILSVFRYERCIFVGKKWDLGEWGVKSHRILIPLSSFLSGGWERDTLSLEIATPEAQFFKDRCSAFEKLYYIPCTYHTQCLAAIHSFYRYHSSFYLQGIELTNVGIPVIKIDITFVRWTIYDGGKTFSIKKKKREHDIPSFNHNCDRYNEVEVSDPLVVSKWRYLRSWGFRKWSLHENRK